jgi:hypothetical protein
VEIEGTPASTTDQNDMREEKKDEKIKRNKLKD